MPDNKPAYASSRKRRTSWRCRHGWHRWFFVSMSDRRMIEVHQHSSWVCTLVERCGRCGLRRTSDHADVPKRPRTGAGATL